MKSSASKIKMTNVDELFSILPNCGNSSEDNQIIEINLEDIYDFEGHTFRILEDEEMKNLIESVKVYGVKQPIIIRKRPCAKGTYECIAGHRRKFAAKKINLKYIPAIIYDMNDDEANMIMIESNKQRNKWLPSEKAKAYKLEYNTLKRQGLKCNRGESAEEVLEKLSGQTIRNVQRYIKLCDLNDNLLSLVDDGKIPVATTAYEMSFLSTEQQKLLEQVINEIGVPTHEEIKYIRKIGMNNDLSFDNIKAYIISNKGNKKNSTLFEKEIISFFPKNFKGDKSALIKKLITNYFEKKGEIYD